MKIDQIKLARGSLKRIFDLFQKGNLSLSAKMAKGSAGSFFLSINNTALSFVLSVALARLMGTAEYGSYTYLLSCVTVLGVFAKMGLDTLIPRQVASAVAKSELGLIVGIFHFGIISILLACLVSLVVFRAFIAYYGFGASYGDDVFLLAFSLLTAGSLLTPFAGVQLGFHHTIWGQFPSLFVLPVVSLALIILTYIFGYSFTTASVLYIQIIATLSAVGVAIIVNRFGPSPSLRNIVPVYRIRSWLKSMLPLIITGGTYIINMNADIILLGMLATKEDAGIYKAATRGADLVAFSLTIISTPLAPIIASLHSEGSIDRLRRGITKASRIGFFVAGMIAVVLFLFGRIFLGMFGEGFERGTTALSILCIGQLVNAGTGPVGWILTMTGHERHAAVGILLGAMCNVILCIILIPKLGLEGAAYATMLSTIVWNLFLVSMIWRKLKIDSTVFGICNVRRFPC